MRNLRVIALVEATSFLALLAATYVKHGQDQPIGVQILGPVHGLLLIAYGLLALDLGRRAPWRAHTTTLILLGAVLPFGGYVVDRWLANAPSGHFVRLTTTPRGPATAEVDVTSPTHQTTPREVVA